MTDQRDNLLVPDHRVIKPDTRLAVPATIGETTRTDSPIVALDDVREAKNMSAKEREQLNERVTKGWAKETFGKLAIELGQKMYDQFSEETAAHLEQMEHDIERRIYWGIVARLENERKARSWYGRFRTLLLRLGAKEKPLELKHPPKVSDAEMRAIEEAQRPAEAP